MGGTAANRITSAVSGVNGTALGAAGGSQGYASGIAQTYLQDFEMTTPNFDISGLEGITGNLISGTQDIAAIDIGNVLEEVFAVSGTVNSGGSGTAFPTLSPTQIIAYQIKC